MTVADERLASKTVGQRPSPLPKSKARRFLRRGFEGLLVFATFAAAAEITARVDDWLRLETPCWSTPDRVHDLTTRDEYGMRGRPGGRYLKWKLNSAGFRGPEIQAEPAAGTTRIAVIGSSEVFGLHETDGQEFVAQLGRKLGPKSEVINAGIPGMTVHSMLPYWEKWVSRFHPSIVVIYASPPFYLADNPPGPSTVIGDVPAPPFQSRMVFRLKQRFDLPEFIHRWRNARAITAHVANRPPGWLFETAPRDRVELYAHDLNALVEAIEKTKAQPILVTHALRTAQVLDQRDRDRLENMRPLIARATGQAILDFEKEANEAVRRVARDKSLKLVDADPVLSGHDDYFGDQMHFNDAGSSVMSQLLYQVLNNALQQP